MQMRKGSARTTVGISIVLVVMLSTVIFGGCGETSEERLKQLQEESRAKQEAAQQLAQIKLDAVKQVTSTMSSVNEGYSRYIEGDVTNNTSVAISYGQVSFTLFDSSGRQVGTALDNCSNLSPGTTWRFKALIFEDEVTKFRFAELEGWD